MTTETDELMALLHKCASDFERMHKRALLAEARCRALEEAHENARQSARDQCQRKLTYLDRAEAAESYLVVAQEEAAFVFGDRVRKKSGSEWQGTVCGFYRNRYLHHNGCAVESDSHRGAIQLYPDMRLEKC
jgi:R67 dihydrofolate reductase